jgi:hypothetical protein
MQDLEWKPVYDTTEAILKDAYENDFVHVKAAGGLKGDFVCDDMILERARAAVAECRSPHSTRSEASALATTTSS